MEKLPKIPENADKLTEQSSVEVICTHIFNEVDMVSFLNKNGCKTVSSDDKNAADISYFVYDKATNTLSSPLMKPEDVLPLMKDLQQKFEQNKISYAPFKTKDKSQFLMPETQTQSQPVSDKEVLEHLLRQNLERRNVGHLDYNEAIKENITENGPQKLYRGTAMGDAEYTTPSDGARAFVYATPRLDSALTYAHQNTTSRFGFIEEYLPSPNQLYSHDHGLESNQCYKDINWQNSSDITYRASETFVEKQTNPHLKTYIYDKQTGTMFTIYENGKYVDKFLEMYAKSRRHKKYFNENLSKRAQNIIGNKKETISEQKLLIKKEGFFNRLKGLFTQKQTKSSTKTQNKEMGRQVSRLRGTLLAPKKHSPVQKRELPQAYLFKESEHTK